MFRILYGIERYLFRVYKGLCHKLKTTNSRMRTNPIGFDLKLFEKANEKFKIKSITCFGYNLSYRGRRLQLPGASEIKSVLSYDCKTLITSKFKMG